MTPLYMSTDGGRSFDNVTVTKKQDYIIRTLMVHPVQDKVLILIYSDNMVSTITCIVMILYVLDILHLL